MGLAVLVFGLVLFLGLHSAGIVGVRDRAVAAIGEGRWKGLYSLGSAVGLVAIVVGYGWARQAPVWLWAPPGWGRHLTMTLMLPVFPLLFAAYLPGRIRALAGGHPMLLAVAVWAFAHLPANGTVADALLFGGFGVWAAVDRASFRWRVARTLPLPAASPVNDAVAVVGGLLAYGLTLWKTHYWLIGVPLIG